MTITLRAYDRTADFDAVGRFLMRHYRPDSQDGNWLQPAWEYFHFHPAADESMMPRFGIWEDSGEIVAVAHNEWELGEAFFQLHPDYDYLKPDLLAYAEAHLSQQTVDGQHTLLVHINDSDTAFETIVLERGYHCLSQHNWPRTIFTIPDPFPAITLPDGYRLLSLADEFDLAKMDRVLWRGFNHPGDNDPDGIDSRRIMTSAPGFRRDLTLVVEAPSGHWVSFCGLWFEPVNRYAYVEPVATDRDYRRMGLGKAAMMEGIRRCAAEGATVAYVGSDQPFYLACGFEILLNSRAWEKKW